MTLLLCGTSFATGARPAWSSDIWKTPGEAAYCVDRAGPTLVRWTPNDGFTISIRRGGMPAYRYLDANRRHYENAPVLRFGERWVHRGTFTCRSATTGLTCTNSAGWGWWLGRYRGYRVLEPATAPALWKTPGEAAYCQASAARLLCWTPNDGFTISMGANGSASYRYLRENRNRFTDARVLAFGESWSRDAFRCSSSSTGLTCRNGDQCGWWLGRYRGYSVYRCASPLTPPSPPPASPPPSPPPASRCDSSYPTLCIPPPPPDLHCSDIPYRNFTVVGSDPHGFDGRDNDGIGCEG